MNKTLICAATALMLSVGAVAAETGTAWNNEYGDAILQDSAANHYKSSDVMVDTQEGDQVPMSVILHPLPSSIQVENSDRYRYEIINHRPVVAERKNRRIVHVW